MAKIELNANDIKLINNALEVKHQQLSRAINTEKDEDIVNIRKKQAGEYTALQAKINTGNLI